MVCVCCIKALTKLVVLLYNACMLITVLLLLCYTTVLCKKSSSTLRSIRKALQTVREGSFARYIATIFKLHARMGCVIIYYVANSHTNCKPTLQVSSS